MEVLTGNTFYFDFEVALMEWLQRVLGETGVQIVSAFSAFGEEFILVAFLGFFYWGYDKKIGRVVGTTIVTALVFNPLVKNLFDRRRPYFDNDSIICYRPLDKNADLYDVAAQGFSFPSGHSTNSAAAYGGVAANTKNKAFKVMAIVLPLLVGVSRVVVGVHYPTDVLVGWIMGYATVALICFLYSKVSEEKIWLMELVIFAISCLGFFYCDSDDFFTGIGIMGGFFLADNFERKFVDFKNTNNIFRCILRVVIGGGFFLAITTVLKMPFSKEFLYSGVFFAKMVRFMRYFIGTFIVIGVYPMAFDKINFNKNM